MRNWTEARYPISVSCEIAKHKLATGRSWYWKRWLYAPTNRPAAGPRGAMLASGQSVMAHGIAAAQAALGCPPALACRAARRFTDISDDLEAPGFKRNPSELFEGSFTYLAAYPDGEARIFRAEGAKKMVLDPETKKRKPIIEKPSLDDVLIGIGRRYGCWLLPLDFIVKHVSIELDKYDEQHEAG
jgi:hypothetical protein